MVNELFCWYKRNLKMKRLTNILAVLLVLCSFGLSPYVTLNAQLLQTRAPDNYADKLRLFEQFVAKQMEKDKIPGLTIGFIKGGEVWVKGFGYADLENKIPAKAESAYRLASVTKTMTGAAIVQLAEKGKINLDAEIQTYVPYYPKQKWAVTVRQLLVHLGGGQTGSGIGADYVTPREVVARIAKNPIQNEPGVKFDYQTSGYNLLGAAIEEVSGKSLNDYFRENFWSPLGMKDTQMDNVRDLIPNRVRGYELVKGEIKNAPFIDVSSRFGGGGLIGTVPDMLNWASNAQSGRILSKSWRELMFTPVANSGRRYVGIGDGTWYYTLGWQVFPVNGRFVFYNDGGQIGTNTMVLRIPSQNLTIAFACNIQNIDRMTYVKRLYEAITGETWDISVYTKDKIDEAIYRGMNSTFNYGSLHLDQTTKPFSDLVLHAGMASVSGQRTVCFLQ
jgi:CubicO group peptidase (beta-lactamase class C family)